MTNLHIYSTAFYARRPGGSFMLMPSAFWAANDIEATGIAMKAVYLGFPVAEGWSAHMAPVNVTSITDVGDLDPAQTAEILGENIRKAVAKTQPIPEPENIGAKVAAEIIAAANKKTYPNL